MTMPNPPPNAANQPTPPASAADATLDPLSLADDELISDEEAEAEIDIPNAAPAPVVASADPATPSVRIAIDKAADILRELRGDRR